MPAPTSSLSSVATKPETASKKFVPPYKCPQCSFPSTGEVICDNGCGTYSCEKCGEDYRVIDGYGIFAGHDDLCGVEPVSD